MKAAWSCVLIVTLMLPLVACSGGAQEQAALPTLVEFPTLPPTATPTDTFTPSPTPSPTLTPTATTTPSPTPTASFTPSLTFTPSITPTFTLTPTFTASPTATATDTPPFTNTPALPVITSFTASTATATPGAQVTLTWAASADTARIERVNASGQVQETFPVSPNGTLLVTIPNAGGTQVIYRLVAARAGRETSLALPIAVSCASPWFFATPPPDAGCPTGPSVVVPGAFQPFQTGFMVHIIITSQNINRVYGAQNENNIYLAYTNLWDGTTIIPGSPPLGLLDAQGVFNWAYNNTLASAGTWNQKIGWAIGNIDTNSRTVQFGADGSVYIGTPAGVYRFMGTAVSGTWSKVN